MADIDKKSFDLLLKLAGGDRQLLDKAIDKSVVKQVGGRKIVDLERVVRFLRNQRLHAANEYQAGRLESENESETLATAL